MMGIMENVGYTQQGRERQRNNVLAKLILWIIFRAYLKDCYEL